MRNDLDRDAFFTFVLSNLLILATAGLTLLYLFYHIALTARRATSHSVNNAQVLVFGHRLASNGEPSRDYRRRLQRAARYLHERPDSTLLLLGGITRAGTPSEAAVGKQYIGALGGPIERVQTEDESQHTLDNLRRAKRMLAPPPARVVLLSNRYHLARALVLAKTMGIDADPCAAEDASSWGSLSLWRMLREAFFLHWYLSGKHWAQLLRNQRMLKRLRP